MLLQRINAADVFDFATDFKAKDVLEITLKADPKETEENATFYFQFKKDKWQFIEHRVFSIMNDYDELRIGKLKGITQGQGLPLPKICEGKGNCKGLPRRLPRRNLRGQP